MTPPPARIRTICWRPCPTASSIPGGAPGTRADAAGRHALRARRAVAARLFPDHRDRVAALRHRDRRVGRIAGVGNEGMVGIALFMGGGSTPSSAVVQTAGHGYRLDRHHLLKQEFDTRRPAAAPAAALHPGADDADGADRRLQPAPQVEQQLSRWLLLTLDRMPADRTGDDAGTGGQHAGRAPRKHHRGGRQLAARRLHPLPPRPHHRAGPGRPADTLLRVLRRGQDTLRGLRSPWHLVGALLWALCLGAAAEPPLRGGPPGLHQRHGQLLAGRRARLASEPRSPPAADHWRPLVDRRALARRSARSAAPRSAWAPTPTWPCSTSDDRITQLLLATRAP
jgi:hypothetical protein